MNPQDVDFIKTLTHSAEPTAPHITKPRKSAFFAWSKVLSIVLALFICAGVVYSTKAVMSGSTLAQQFGNTSVINQIKHLVGSNDRPLQGEDVDRINILVMGVGGENHDGGELTDTIILASIEPSTNSVGLLSIPRDLVAPIEGVGWQKINAANAYGKAFYPDEPGAGPRLAMQTVSNVTGIDIQYYIKVDFSGFVKLVDALGGLDIDVPQAFTDEQYPDEQYGYDPVHFDEGTQHLTGERALKYARSRHGTNQEGSDFARARRQQQIIKALQDKATGISTFLNPNKVLSLMDIVSGHVETNMEIWESLRLFDIAKHIDRDAIKQIVLSSEQNGLLVVDTNEDGAYLLRPRLGAGNFDEIKSAALALLDTTPTLSDARAVPEPAVETPTEEKVEPLPTTATPPVKEVDTPKADTPAPDEQAIRVSVLNGTLYPGLAGATATRLRGLGFSVGDVANAPRQNYERTVLYALTPDSAELEDALARIRAELGVNVAPSVPVFVESDSYDIVLILGSDMIPR